MNTPTINSNAYKKQGLSIVVFGASGHLARVKIMPSLFRLFGHYDKLPPFTFIYGYARTKMTSEEWRESLKRDLMSTSGANSDLVTEFLSKCVYVSGDSYRDVAAYSRLVELIKEQEDQHSLMHQQLNRMFYLAVPPNVFIDAAMSIHLHCMQTPECGWTRIVVEKPFGRDLATYQELQHALLSNCSFDESILYRIDHYLAKTMVEQIIPLRQSNLWKKRVSSVYIVWKETHSLKTRGGGYFDHYGIVRDVVQNHLLQLLTLIAMELNDVVDVSIHERKCKVLEQTRVVGPALFGQYQGYGNDVGNAKSATPTYALVRLQVNTPQWNGVPFIIEAGKALHESVCEIRLQLDSPGCVEVVVLRVQPNPAIIYYYDRTRIKALLEWSKSSTSKIVSVPLEYKKTTFPNFTEDAYSKLLCHVLNGNKEQFVHNDELEMSWKIVTPILEPRECEIQQYEQGSCGPPGRMEFLERAEIPNAACSVDINNAGTVYLQSSL